MVFTSGKNNAGLSVMCVTCVSLLNLDYILALTFLDNPRSLTSSVSLVSCLVITNINIRTVMSLFLLYFSHQQEICMVIIVSTYLLLRLSRSLRINALPRIQINNLNLKDF